jgi:hypothetical protein
MFLLKVVVSREPDPYGDCVDKSVYDPIKDVFSEKYGVKYSLTVSMS